MLEPKKLLLLPRQSESCNVGGLAGILLNKTKRYARLVTENVRNFQSYARVYDGSRI